MLIREYTLSLVNQPYGVPLTVAMPDGAQIVRAEQQTPTTDPLYVWVLVDPNQPVSDKSFVKVPANSGVPAGATYVAPFYNLGRYDQIFLLGA